MTTTEQDRAQMVKGFEKLELYTTMPTYRSIAFNGYERGWNERNQKVLELQADAERYRYLKSCFTNEYQLIEFARRLGCRDDEFLPSMDYVIDAAMKEPT